MIEFLLGVAILVGIVLAVTLFFHVLRQNDKETDR